MSIEQRDRKFALKWSAILLAMLLFPYLLLWLLTPKGSNYTGLLFNPSDTFLYYSQMFHSHLGPWQFTDYFTYLREPQLAIYGLYSLLGRFLPGSASIGSIALVFHLSRILLAVLFLWQAWLFYKEVLANRISKRIGFLFLLFTSGMAIFQLLIPILNSPSPPFDLLITESSSFSGLLYAPHFAAVLFLLVTCARYSYKAFLSDSKPHLFRSLFIASISSLFLSTIHPDKIGVLIIALALYVLWTLYRQEFKNWSIIWKAALIISPSIPYLLFSYNLTVSDPQIQALIQQGLPHESVSQPLLYYGFGFGIPLICALVGLPRILKNLKESASGEIYLWSFVIAGFIIIFLPFKNVGHRGEGLQLFLAALAGRNLTLLILPKFWKSRFFNFCKRKKLFGYSRRKLRLLSINLVIIISASSVMALTFSSPRGALAGVPEIYISQQDEDALYWIRQNVSSNDTIVGEPISDEYIAAFSGAHAAWGSWSYTPNYNNEGNHLRQFFLGQEDPHKYLTSRGIKWFYFGPRERQVTKFTPSTFSYLREAYHNSQIVIYKVSQ
jgi:hypothetical protein